MADQFNTGEPLPSKISASRVEEKKPLPKPSDSNDSNDRYLVSSKTRADDGIFETVKKFIGEHKKTMALVGIVVIVVIVLFVIYGIVKPEQKKHQRAAQAAQKFGKPPVQRQRYGSSKSAGAAQPPNGQNDAAGAGQGNASAHDGEYPGQGPVASERDQVMDVEKLMPAGWSKGAHTAACPPDEEEDEAQWTKYAPSREQFNQYIASAGSARLSMNSRSPLSRQIGLPNMLRASPKVPLSGYQSEFLDTDMRQTLIYDATGQYPASTSC